MNSTRDLTEYEGPDLAGLAAAWWLFLIVGIASFVAGIILVTKPSNSLATLAVIFGILLLFNGVIELFRSFGHSVENRAFAAILGLLGVIIGIALIRHPFHGVAAIGLLIGIWLVAAGLMSLVRAIAEPYHRLLRLLIAAIEVVVGIIVISDPHIGYATLAVLLGIWLLINGIATVVLAFAVRSAKHEATA